MKNFAIVLGSSVYDNANNLPGCKNDIKAMSGLLEATQKYEVLVIDELERKNEVLEKINQFLFNNNDEEVGEIFLYYTGHGYSNGKFYFVLKDTIISKINSTAICNDEMDDIIRKINPRLFVKVIDACESEISYIKNLQSKDFLYKTFENCRFMFSSKRTQSSYATENISFFTKEFINAIGIIGTSTIKYRDIENQISDAFSVNMLEQTPMFSNQTDGQEIFCEKTDTLNSFLVSWDNYCKAQGENVANQNIEEKINRYTMRCREKDDVEKIVNKLINEFKEKEIKESWLNKFYDVEIQELSYDNSVKYTENKSLGEWLQKNKNSLKLFVEINTKHVEVTEKSNNFFANYIAGILYRDVVTGYRTNVDGLSSGILFSCVPRNKNLPRYDIVILIVYGVTCFCTMSNMECYIREAWDEYSKFSADGYKNKIIEYEDATDQMIEKYVDQQIDILVEFAEKSLMEYIGE